MKPYFIKRNAGDPGMIIAPKDAYRYVIFLLGLGFPKKEISIDGRRFK